MIKWLRIGIVLALLGFCNWMTERAVAQTFERNTKVTGPRGRSIDRQVDVERAPGTFSRQVQIQRPGGTIDRSTTIQRGWGGWPGGGFGGFRPLPFFPGPRPVTSWGLGITAAPVISIPFFAGGARLGVAGSEAAWAHRGWVWEAAESPVLERRGRPAGAARTAQPARPGSSGRAEVTELSLLEPTRWSARARATGRPPRYPPPRAYLEV